METAQYEFPIYEIDLEKDRCVSLLRDLSKFAHYIPLLNIPDSPDDLHRTLTTFQKLPVFYSFLMSNEGKRVRITLSIKQNTATKTPTLCELVINDPSHIISAENLPKSLLNVVKEYGFKKKFVDGQLFDGYE